MSDHLPWVNHLAAREAGMGLMEFAALNPAEQNEWIRFTLKGPSGFRDTLNIAHIRSMVFGYLAGSKKIPGVDEDWLDGVMEHPDAAWERRVNDVKAKRKADRIAEAKALHAREWGGRVKTEQEG